VTATIPERCERCRTEIAPGLLLCPACGTLVHASTLSELAREAQAAEDEGNASLALGHWNEALTLLPRDAAQRAQVLARIERLEQTKPSGGRDQAAAPPKPGGLKGVWLGIVSAVIFLLGKLKLLLLGFTKLGTLLSMAAFFGVYWTAFGWQFALGLVLSIYVHEMGHVASLRHYGIPASAPMFIPGLGALVRLKAHPPTPAQDARVGLAGPIWGTGAALVCLGLYQATGNGLFAGLTHVGAVINLFNLIPFWQLDGGRGIRPLAASERWLLLAAILVAFSLTHESMLVLVGIGVAVQAFIRGPRDGDRGALTQFVLLIALLAFLATVRAPGLGLPEPQPR
jgi:Zn-dependent protease